MITQARLRELFTYNKKTGNLIWRKPPPGRVKIGDIAGSIDHRGYRQICCDGYRFRAHQLVWVWHYGVWPEFEIDHKNRLRSDNRIGNLRDVTKSVNGLNRDTDCGISGYPGVQRQRRSDKWRARIRFSDQGVVHLGSFTTAEEAFEAFCEAHYHYHGADSRYFVALHTPSHHLVAWFAAQK